MTLGVQNPYGKSSTVCTGIRWAVRFGTSVYVLMVHILPILLMYMLPKASVLSKALK